MQFNRREARQLLRDFEFQTLFIEELGWDRLREEVKAEIRESAADYGEYQLTAVAEKRGLAVFHCSGRTDGSMPDHAARSKIQRRVAKSYHENFIIYTDAEKTKQIWQWVKRESEKPLACREYPYDSGQSGEALVQILERIAFSLKEEESLTLGDVTTRVQTAFDVEQRITKRFYDRFKTEHAQFLKFLNGIPDDEMQRWYVSVMLNRLMFIYFIQKKGFLDDDIEYLRTKLTQSQALARNRYYTDFLCPLFFEGFAKTESERDVEARRLLGTVPYLNGGIFQRHQLEELHGEKIQIADAAFEKLFNFFEAYQWHLDDRQLKNDNEINPDVLGYIFEKYINQKQMGAYYTKEDITEYISKNTIIPFLLDTARENCKIAFTPPVRSSSTSGSTGTVWQLLADNPGRYIYDIVKKGVKLNLPARIAAGIDDVPKRTEWNTPAPDEYALPTEIWREVVARRARYNEIYAKLSNGEIYDINNLITYNLNIRQFTQDVIENCEGPELLRAFWSAITQVTVLDPTCGSGAFLFAALNILEPLYEACLDRMQVFLDELSNTGESPHFKKYADFRKILNRVDEHANRNYFILKSIIINNLYGVDIMEEAIEICKLRLFLKMVAQIENVRQIEPLPDIDFNIQAGNSLVGYATYDELERAVTENRIDFDNTMARIQESVEDVDHLFAQFRQKQTELRGSVSPANKQALQDKLRALEDELNRYLAGEYNVDPNNETDYRNWLSSHKPFHWFVEFYGILKDGGFDVIIGNPPYVEYNNKVKKQYTVTEYKTEKCGNLYPMTIERSFDLSKGPVGMIVQLPLVCTDRMKPAQSLFKTQDRITWFASFDDRPGKLFDDLQHIRAAIFVSITERNLNAATMYATQYKRWFTEARSNLFEGITYEDITKICFEGVFPKIADPIGKRIVNTLRNANKSIFGFKTGKFLCHYHNSPQYWIRATDFIPYFRNERDGTKQSLQIKDLRFKRMDFALAVCCLLNSSLFYWWFIITSDCRHLNIREIINFSFDPEKMDKARITQLSEIAAELMADYRYHATRKETNYRTTGKVVYDEFYPRRSKSIIDKIDHVLAQHYGFTDEELDFIINYDIKYRMGLGNERIG